MKVAGEPLRRGHARIQWLIVVICSVLAMVLRLYYVNVAIVDHPVRGDAVNYYAYAWNLLHNGVFSHVIPGEGPPVADSYRDPGYPALMAAVMRLAGDEDWYPALLGLQAILGAATVFLALALGRRWLSWPWLAGAGVLMAIWPHSITSASYLLTETLCGFFVTLGTVLASSRAAQYRGVPLIAGVVLGAAGLTNAILLPFGMILAGCLAVFRGLPRSSAGLLLLGSLLLPGAWAVRNATLPVVAPAPNTTSTDRAIQNFVQGSWPQYHSAWYGRLSGDPEATRAMARIDGEIAAMVADPSGGASAVVRRLASSPLLYSSWYLSKPMLLWGWDIRIGAGDVFIYPVVKSPYLSSPFFMLMAAIAHALNVAMFLAASIFCILVVLRPAMRNDGKLQCAILLLYVTAIYCVLQSEPRYSIPFRPLQLLAAVAMLDWSWRLAMHWKGRGKSPGAHFTAEGAD